MPAMKSFYGNSRKNDKLQGGGCGGEGGRGKNNYTKHFALEVVHAKC